MDAVATGDPADEPRREGGGSLRFVRTGVMVSKLNKNSGKIQLIKSYRVRTFVLKFAEGWYLSVTVTCATNFSSAYCV